MKILKIFLLATGFVILWATVRAVGWESILSHLNAVGFKFLPVLLIYAFIFAFDTLGWRYAFPKNLPTRVPFGDLCRIRLIGETLNHLIPWAASLGGEPIKAELLRRRHGIRLSEGFASILIVHTTFWLSLNLFVIGGVAVTFKTLPLTPVLRNSVVAFLIVLGIGALLLVAGLHLGIFKRVHAIGKTFRWWGDESEEKKTRFLELDDQIKKFYTANFRSFFLSAFFNFLGWFAGIFEVYFLSKILGWNISWEQAWLFEALIQVLRITTFFIPSSIGAQEAGIVLIFLQFGFEKSLGLTFAVLRRIREMVWLGIGLVLSLALEERPLPEKN
ncbi:MAG: flippase-like domain-containing protein [Candidatus Omnitrophica bacterium]|nr:flippase-like domain-containing protein [Candidatus Omnitrophota bacterium]